MDLAACYIVKNGAKDLERSLRSLALAVNELIVVDTGSTDDTVRVAESFGATVCHFSWVDHFAKARNFALEQVQSPWLIFLDADEYFRHPKEVRPALLEKITAEPDCDVIMLIRYNIDPDAKTSGAMDISPRVLRNTPAVRYSGRIHEMPGRTDGRLKVSYADERLALNHTGYSRRNSAKKINRNIALIMQDIKENGHTPFHDYHLAQEYFGRRDYQKALSHAMEALDSDMILVGGQGELYHLALESMHQLNLNFADRLTLADVAIRELPELPEFYAERGMVLGGMGRLQEAKASFETAMGIFDRSPVNYKEASYFTPRVAAIVCKKLAELCEMLGDRSNAEKWLARAFTLNPRTSGLEELQERLLKREEDI
ncbi:MAG: glycosyltransferase [Selenomonadaceae bacterium]|nr:glycosyltransferase [Selenomonadaceae bacterium]